LAREMGADVSKKKVGDLIRDMEEQVIFEGNRVRPWDIYNLIRDPFTTVNHCQEAAYRGRMYRTNATQKLLQERDAPGRRFNAKYAAALAENGMGTSEYINFHDSGIDVKLGFDDPDPNETPAYSNVVDCAWLEIYLVPKDHGIGDEEYPVRYEVEISCDR